MKVCIAVNAGLLVKNAWIRITETEGEKSKANNYTDKNYLSKNYRDNYYLIEEMLLTRRQMENGLSEEKAYELFGRRIGLLSYMKFCTLLVQNMKKGTADLIKFWSMNPQMYLTRERRMSKYLERKQVQSFFFP